ncbi:MAG: AMIN domain-containing protein, partial [Nitrosospira sp.]
MANPNKPLIAATAHCPSRSVPPAFSLLLSMATLLLLTLSNTVFANTLVSSVRVWPAPEYTRLTLESALPIQYSLSMVKDPDRVVVD